MGQKRIAAVNDFANLIKASLMLCKPLFSTSNSLLLVQAGAYDISGNAPSNLLKRRCIVYCFKLQQQAYTTRSIWRPHRARRQSPGYVDAAHDAHEAPRAIIKGGLVRTALSLTDLNLSATLISMLKIVSKLP